MLGGPLDQTALREEGQLVFIAYAELLQGKNQHVSDILALEWHDDTLLSLCCIVVRCTCSLGIVRPSWFSVEIGARSRV